MFRRAAIAAVAMLAVAPALGASLPARAAEPAPTITESDDRLEIVARGLETDENMVVWARGRRAYQLARTQAQVDAEGLPDQIAAIDLDELEEVARITAPESATPTVGPTVFMDDTLLNQSAIDEQGGRLFVLYSAAARDNCGLAYCIRGVHVFDARTLEPLADFPLSPEFGALPGTGSLAYANGKLYLLSPELGNDGLTKDTRDRRNTVRVGQIDATTGTADWVAQADACTSNPAATARTAGQYSVGRSADAVYLTCYSSAFASRVVRIPVADGQPGAQQSFPGPRFVHETRVDAAGERVLLKSEDSDNTTWWVFDGKQSSFVGVVGIGPYNGASTTAGLDPTTGRLYSLGAKKAATETKPATAGGLLVTDTRRTPLPQATPFANFEPMATSTTGALVVEPATPGHPRRVFVRQGTGRPGSPPSYYRVLIDRLPVSTDPPGDDPDQRTVDVPEREGITSSTFTGSAAGYGFRSLLIGGTQAVVRDPGADTSLLFSNFLVQDPEGRCGPADRELLLGSAGPAKFTDQGSDAQSQAAYFDPNMQEDAVTPVARCTPVEVSEELFVGTPLQGTDPPPAVQGTLEDEAPFEGTVLQGSAIDVDRRLAAADCVAPDPDPTRASSTVTHKDLPGFRARAECGSRVDAEGRAVFASGVGYVNVGHASSRVEMIRDPVRGVVTRVTSEARAVEIAGVGRIDLIRAEAESWANGRKQPANATDYQNCETTRTAGTCFRRSIFGVELPGYSCGLGSPCGDEAAFVAAMQRALGASWQLRLREPDINLAKGSPGGYVAAVQKPPSEQFSDAVLNNDPRPTLPALELVHFADGAKGRGRQVYQFGGVEVATTYGIELLPTEEPPPPGGLRIALADDDEEPLAGGVFMLHNDADGDGALGLDDMPVDAGVCETGGDGSCGFVDLAAGPYVVEQVTAPEGYAKAPDAAVFVEPGSVAVAAFINVRDIGRVELTLTDDADPPAPLAGGEFELVADDGDGVNDDDDRVTASCTTLADGACAFEAVPTGAYLLVQRRAPDDYVAAEPVAFALDAPGQVATIHVVNGLAPIDGTEGTAGTPGTEGTPGDDGTGTGGDDEFVEEIVEEPMVVELAGGDFLPIAEVWYEPIDEGPVDVLRRFLRAPADLGRFILRNPLEAVLFAGVWILLGAAVLLVARRRRLATLSAIT